MPGFGWIEVHAVDHCNNSCKYCNNSSPYATRKQYDAEDYLPYLDILEANKVTYHCISVMGGEPFLHKNITRFVEPLKKYNKSLMLTTNGYWLTKANIEKFSDLFELIDILCFSLYPNIIERFDDKQSMLDLISEIQNRHGHLRLDIRDITQFWTFEFLTEPVTVDRFCPASDCITLLADGRMGRCGIGSFASINPNVTSEFLACRDIFYDLNQFDYESFWMWRKRWPFDACAYCTNFLNQSIGWEYEDRIPDRKKRDHS